MEGRDRAALLEDPTNSRAVVRSLEVIGEAVKKLPAELRSKYPQVEWSDIAGMRDVLIHHYFGIDHDIVWGVLRKEIPELPMNSSASSRWKAGDDNAITGWCSRIAQCGGPEEDSARELQPHAGADL